MGLLYDLINPRPTQDLEKALVRRLASSRLTASSPDLLEALRASDNNVEKAYLFLIRKGNTKALPLGSLVAEIMADDERSSMPVVVSPMKSSCVIDAKTSDTSSRLHSSNNSTSTSSTMSSIISGVSSPSYLQIASRNLGFQSNSSASKNEEGMGGDSDVRQNRKRSAADVHSDEELFGLGSSKSIRLKSGEFFRTSSTPSSPLRGYRSLGSGPSSPSTSNSPLPGNGSASSDSFSIGSPVRSRKNSESLFLGGKVSQTEVAAAEASRLASFSKAVEFVLRWFDTYQTPDGWRDELAQILNVKPSKLIMDLMQDACTAGQKALRLHKKVKKLKLMEERRLVRNFCHALIEPLTLLLLTSDEIQLEKEPRQMDREEESIRRDAEEAFLAVKASSAKPDKAVRALKLYCLHNIEVLMWGVREEKRREKRAASLKDKHTNMSSAIAGRRKNHRQIVVTQRQVLKDFEKEKVEIDRRIQTYVNRQKAADESTPMSPAGEMDTEDEDDSINDVSKEQNKASSDSQNNNDAKANNNAGSGSQRKDGQGDVDKRNHAAANKAASASSEPELDLSMFFDFLQSSDPQAVAFLASRKIVREKVAAQEDRVKQLEARGRFFAKCQQLLDAVWDHRESSMKEEDTGFKQTQAVMVDAASNQLMEAIPQLCCAVQYFANFHQERKSKAEKTLEKRKNELEEHRRFYGDEAPQERLNLEARVREFSKIVLSSHEALKEVANSQSIFWADVFGYLPSSVQSTLTQSFSQLKKDIGSGPLNLMCTTVSTLGGPASRIPTLSSGRSASMDISETSGLAHGDTSRTSTNKSTGGAQTSSLTSKPTTQSKSANSVLLSSSSFSPSLGSTAATAPSGLSQPGFANKSQASSSSSEVRPVQSTAKSTPLVSSSAAAAFGTEDGQPSSQQQQVTQSKTQAKQKQRVVKEGDRIFTRFSIGGNMMYVGGQIQKVNMERGTADVMYDDGDGMAGVAFKHLLAFSEAKNAGVAFYGPSLEKEQLRQKQQQPQNGGSGYKTKGVHDEHDLMALDQHSNQYQVDAGDKSTCSIM